MSLLVAVTCFKFGEFELDHARFELRRNGRAVKLERIPMDLLILLIEKDGNVVTRREIVEQLWGKDVFVDTEHGINTAIRKIRAVLREDAERPGFIQTVPGRGYRFVAESSTISTSPRSLKLINSVPVHAASVESVNPQSVPAQSVPAKTVPVSGEPVSGEGVSAETASVKAVPPSLWAWRTVAIALLALCAIVGLAIAFNVRGLRNLVVSKNSSVPIHSAAARAVDPEVHDDYLRGRYLLGLASASHAKLSDQKQYREQDVLEAIGQFKQAIVKDPGYALAYAGLANAYIVLGNPVWGGQPPRQALFDAKAAAAKSLELDPSLAEVHFALAQTLEYEWNWPEAEKEYRLALSLDPNYVDARVEYGRFLQALGRNNEAVAQMNNATQLDPFGVKTKVFVAYVTYASRQYDLAIKQFESLGDDWGLIWAYRDKKMYPQAVIAWQGWERSHPAQRHDPVRLATIAGIYGLEGKRPEARKLIEELKGVSRHRYVSGLFFAEAYLGLGEKDQAIASLEQAYDERDQWMVFANSYPGLDGLHSEPRFQALIRRMNFPQ
jgi:DNA-binding winged helix-turn-helix (wHTH) protein/tetratricopeptide (TPR) repeat protein